MKGRLLVVALVAVACSSNGTGPQSPEPLPDEIRECETGVTTYCGVWTLVDDSVYRGVWEQGTVANISVIRFRPDSVVFFREDVSGPSAGVVGIYRGRRDQNRVVEGTVIWTSWFQHGVWTAEW